MADEYGDEDMMQVGSSPLAVIASLGNQYTSREAYDLAKKAYEDLSVERSELLADQDAVDADMARVAEDAKRELSAARQRLLDRKFDQSAKWLALAEGFGTPTRSGGIGETIANVARGQRGVNDDRREYIEKQELGATAYGQQISGIDQALARARADMAKARATNNTRLMQEAMKTLSREVRGGGGGSGGISNWGKIAIDEGYKQGTPAFNARVRQLQADDARNRRATAGTDAPGEESQITQEDEAYRFGVPRAVVDPYKGMSTKQKNAAMTIDQRDTQNRLEELSKSKQDAVDGITKMNRFMRLNAKSDTGKVKGALPALSSAGQEMDAITAEVARKMKQPGEGSVSDFDGKQFILATVSRGKNFAANRGVATAYKIMRKNEIDRINFMQDYATLNGHLRGADVAWREYLEANPIFDPSKPDSFELNPNRQRDYRVWFREQMGDQQAVDVDPAIGDLAADDNESGHFPGEDEPARAYAGGGKVGALRQGLKSLEGNTAQGVRHKELLRRRGLYDAMFENGDINEKEYEEALTKVEAQLRKVRYADGGSVSDDDIYGVPDEVPTAEDDADGEGTGGLREALYAALQGLTAGTADEIRGTVDPEGAAQDRAEYSEYAGERPVQKAAAFSAGLLPLAAAAPGGGLLSSILTGMSTGALLGATGSMEDRDLGAVQGGIEGAIVAPAAALGTRYLYNKAGQLVDRLTGRPLSPAEEKLVMAANRDNIDLLQVAADLRASDRLSVPEGVADRGGRRTQALIEKAATRGGDESEAFLEGQGNIQDRASGRVEGQLNQALVPSEYFSEFEKLKNELYTNSKPLYEAAYKKYPGLKSRVFDEIASTKDGKDAIREAFRLMENDRVPIGKAGPGGMVQRPNLQFLDYVKRGLDQKITTEEASGATPLGHSLRSVRNRLRDELDRLAPEYRAAREQYAGDLEVMDALKLGREDIARMQPEEVRKLVAGMSYAEKDAFKSGVSQHLFEILGRPTTDFNAAQRILGSDSMREKLKASIDDPKKWKIFEAAMDKEMQLFARNKKMLSRVEGKKTQALSKEDSVLSNVLDGGMANAPSMGGITWLNRVYNWLRFPLPMSEETADQILKTIDRNDVKAFDARMQKLAGAQKRLATRGKRSGKAGAIAAVLGAGLMQPTPPGEAADLGEDE